jgi:hypothetical protein
MDHYGNLVREVAADQDAILVDTQRNFDQILTWVKPQDLAFDRVHINLNGHLILARAFLQQINFSWDRSPP